MYLDFPKHSKKTAQIVSASAVILRFTSFRSRRICHGQFHFLGLDRFERLVLYPSGGLPPVARLALQVVRPDRGHQGYGQGWQDDCETRRGCNSIV